MPAKIVLDANTLVAQHFLKGHLGIALVFAARRMQATIVLPQATLDEARVHAVRLARDRRRDINTAANQLQVILGGRPAIEWPGDTAITAAIDAHLKAITDCLQQPEMDLELARAALARVIEHRPPAHNSEEFRDALLWEAVLRTARDSTVYFVTEDKDFLIAKEGKRGLHPELSGEISRLKVEVEHHLTLASLLDALGPEVRQPDKATVSKVVGEALLPIVQQELVSKGVTLQTPLTLQENRAPDWKVFATQDPNRLALSFNTPFPASSTSAVASSPIAAVVLASGSASLDPRTNQLSNIDLDRIDVSYADGGRGGITYLRSADQPSNMTWRPYEFREPL